MKNVKNIFWGLLLVVIGVVWGLNALGFTNIVLFFDGWWTLFIIVPCFIGLFSEQDKTGNLVGILGGLLLLAGCQDWISFDLVWKLVVPVAIIVVGLRLLFKDLFDRKAKKGFATACSVVGKLPEYAAVFSSQKLHFGGQSFAGAELHAVFGAVECDLRGALFAQDVPLRISTVFGGATVILPEGIDVQVVSNSLFGGVSNKHQNTAIEGVRTVYINANSIFGGVDIK